MVGLAKNIDIGIVISTDSLLLDFGALACAVAAVVGAFMVNGLFV